MNFFLGILLVAIGVSYLFFFAMMSFKQRSNVIWIVLLNIGIFIYSYVYAPHLITKYAVSGAKIMSGQAYTMFSYMFFHANPTHLFVNTLGLLFFGYNMEKHLGWPQFMMVYFISGFLGAGFFTLLAPANISTVGASGAIYGIMAYFTLVRPFMISPMPFLIPIPVSLASVLYVVSVIPLMVSGDFATPVAHMTHIGGMLGGVLMAFGMNYLQAVKGLIVILFIAVLTYFLPLALS